MPERLSDVERRRLEAQLGEQLRGDCEESERLCYSPRQFRIMLAESGPIGACMARKIPDGFLKLLELKRLDLAAEATILRPP
jgi:hypothetical protein